MDEITIHEARLILKRLVNERKSLEKALEAAEQLSNIEINIVDRQRVLDDLTAMCTDKEQKLRDIDANIEEIHQLRERACSQREKESNAKVETQQAFLADLKDQYARLQVEHDKVMSILAAEHKQKVLECQTEIDDLTSRVQGLRAELSGLQAAARKLAGE